MSWTNGVKTFKRTKTEDEDEWFKDLEKRYVNPTFENSEKSIPLIEIIRIHSTWLLIL